MENVKELVSFNIEMEIYMKESGTKVDNKAEGFINGVME